MEIETFTVRLAAFSSVDAYSGHNKELEEQEFKKLNKRLKFAEKLLY